MFLLGPPLIFNGRANGDSLGELTFFCSNRRGSSTIDYAIGSPNLLNSGTDLKVLSIPSVDIQFDHAPISLDLAVDTKPVKYKPKNVYTPKQRLR